MIRDEIQKSAVPGVYRLAVMSQVNKLILNCCVQALLVLLECGHASGQKAC